MSAEKAKEYLDDRGRTENESAILYDKDIREPLFDFLEEKFGKVRILEEKRTGNARADAVMITMETLYGIEIKSDADTYARLEKQVRNYDCYYDKNIIVVGTSHAAHVKEHVPDWWGIITVELDDKGEVDFYVLREATINPKVIDVRKITILWRTELNNLLKKNGLPGYLQKSKKFVQEKLIEKVPGDILWPQAYEELFERDYNTIGQQIEEFRNSSMDYLNCYRISEKQTKEGIGGSGLLIMRDAFKI